MGIVYNWLHQWRISYELHAIMNYYYICDQESISRNDLLPVCFAVFSKNEKGNEMPPKMRYVIMPSSSQTEVKICAFLKILVFHKLPSQMFL